MSKQQQLTLTSTGYADAAEGLRVYYEIHGKDEPSGHQLCPQDFLQKPAFTVPLAPAIRKSDRAGEIAVPRSHQANPESAH
jgi:hypothetical protein